MANNLHVKMARTDDPTGVAANSLVKNLKEPTPVVALIKEELREAAKEVNPPVLANTDPTPFVALIKDELQQVAREVNPPVLTNTEPTPVVAKIKQELKEVVIVEEKVKPRHFVFAYGSLICKKSRLITAPSLADKEAIPVQIQGVERIWAKRTQRGMTAMGVRFRPGAVCTGVLLPVTEAELQRFDRREQGYDRYPIPLEQVEEVPFLAQHYEKKDYELADVVFANDADDDAKEETKQNDNHTEIATTRDEASPPQPEVFVWIYVQRYDCPADEDYPIAQSYVDIIMRGCMGISKEFARSFIETTKGWTPEEIYGEGNDDDPVYDSDDEDEEERNNSKKEGPPPGCTPNSNGNTNQAPAAEEGATWVDDRDEPIYMRADPVYSEKKATLIDQLLEEKIPDQLDNREPVNDDDTDDASDDGGLA